MRGRGWLLVVLCFSILLAKVDSSYGQAGLSFAQLNGTVLDEKGGSVGKASIALVEMDTNRSYSATANDNGYYVVPNLTPGRYELKVTFSGFADYTRTEIVLRVGQTATIDVTLRVAGVGEKILVTTEVPAVEPTRTEVSQVIDSRQIDSLPVSGRLFTDFALLTPGVATSRTSLGTTFTEFEITQISFGGMRGFSNMITVDGADFINAQAGVQRASPPQEAVQEFRVVNSSFGSEYGRAMGGIVNVVTKSGANDLHGSIYDYLQNDHGNARTLLQPGSNFAGFGLPGPTAKTLRQNQYGGTLGGPLKKDKTFFFINYEGQRRAEAPVFPSDFISNFAQINNVKVNYLGIPAEVIKVKTKNNDYGFARLDHQISANNRVAFRYNVEDARDLNQLVGNTEDGGGIGTPSGGRDLFIRDQTVVGTLDSSLKPQLINTFLAQYARRHYFFPGSTGEPNLDIPNDLSFGHNFGTFDAIYESRIQFSDAMAWVKGNHVVKFGFDSNFIWDYSNFPGFTPMRVVMPGLNCLADFANFVDFKGLAEGGAPVSFPGPPCPTAGSGDQGVPVMFYGIAIPRVNGPGANEFHYGYQPPGPFNNGPVDHNWPNAFVPANFDSYAFRMNHAYYGVFGQDQWRLNSKLTLNYGVRWDVETGLSRQIKTDYKGFQPRVGFAYSPDSKTVIRAGAGLFDDRQNMTFFFVTGNQKTLPGFICNPVADGPNCAAGAGRTPITVPQVRQGAADGGWQLTQVIPLPIPGLTSLAADDAKNILLTGLYNPAFLTGTCPPACNVGAGGMAKDSKLPYAIQASFEIDREIGKGLTVDIGYLFVGAHRLVRGNNINVPCPDGMSKPGNPADAQGWLNPDGTLTPCTGTPNLVFGKPHFGGATAPVPFTPVEFTEAGLLDYNNGVVNANYHGATFQAIERFGKYFRLNANYTFSKTIDNGNFTTFINLPQNQFDYAAERALSNQDVRHRFVANFSLDGPEKTFVRDFRLSSVITAQTGRPFTMFAGFDANNDTNPVTDRVGLAGRNTYTGDKLIAVDMRLSRAFRFHERSRIELAIDAFNLFNRQNVDEVTSVYLAPVFIGPVPKHYKDGIGAANPNFGLPRTMLNPRQLQVSAKISF